MHTFSTVSVRLRAALAFALTIAIATAGIAVGAGRGGGNGHTGPAYENPRLPVAERVDDLLSRMTLAEKVGQMGQINATVLQGDPANPWDRAELNTEMLDLVLNQNQIGSILSGGGASPAVNTPRAWAEMTNTIQRFAIEHSRLGIPIVYGVDAVHGHNNVLGATFFPHQIGLGSSFDPALVQRLGDATARAVRATGMHWNFAPVADTARDLRWGRYYEPFGEDPLLTGTLAAAAVRGNQGRDLSSPEQVAATTKHFTGYSAPDSGQDRTDATISTAQLQDVHLPPFADTIEAGAATAMANSSSVNTIPVHGSHELLTERLRGELGFGGVLVSDWQDVENLLTKYHVVDTYEDAIALAVNSGVDMSMIPLDAAQHTEALTAAVEHGKVSMERIDEAVRRILTLKFRLGLFERPYVDASKANRIVSDPDQLPLARKAASESLVLLENHDRTLPFSARTDRVLVTGPSADSPANQLGGWSIGWQGVPEDEVPEVTTVVEGVERAVSRGTDVAFEQGVPAGVDDPDDPTAVAARDQAVAAASDADAVVVAVGEPPYAETPGDTNTAALPAAQARLIDELVATGTPVAVVVIAGRPLIMNEQLDAAGASLMAFLPGTEGGSAIADALFGRTDPSGRLSVSWPRSIDQAPLFYNRAAGEDYDPRYEFGHGLSYTPVEVKRLWAPSAVDADGVLRLAVELRNAARDDAEEPVLAFVERTVGPPTAAVRQLVAFERVDVDGRDSERERMSFAVERLAATQPSGEREVVPGTYRLVVGDAERTFVVR